MAEITSQVSPVRVRAGSDVGAGADPIGAAALSNDEINDELDQAFRQKAP